MVTRIFAVISALLAAFAIYQYNQIGQLRADLAIAEARGAARAKTLLVQSLAGQGEEMQRTMTWLNDYYKSADGLKRPEGLWIHEHPDFEGLGTWVFSVYLPHRVKGDDETQARQAVVDAIKQSDEWQTKHKG